VKDSRFGSPSEEERKRFVDDALLFAITLGEHYWSPEEAASEQATELDSYLSTFSEDEVKSFVAFLVPFLMSTNMREIYRRMGLDPSPEEIRQELPEFLKRLRSSVLQGNTTA